MEERLNDGIVVTVAGTAHTLDKAMVLQESGNIVTGVLAATIGMKQQS
jgi:hypothetical protein